MLCVSEDGRRARRHVRLHDPPWFRKIDSASKRFEMGTPIPIGTETPVPRSHCSQRTTYRPSVSRTNRGWCPDVLPCHGPNGTEGLRHSPKPTRRASRSRHGGSCALHWACPGPLPGRHHPGATMGRWPCPLPATATPRRSPSSRDSAGPWFTTVRDRPRTAPRRPRGPGGWFSPRGDRWWRVWSCPDHIEGLTGLRGFQLRRHA